MSIRTELKCLSKDKESPILTGTPKSRVSDVTDYILYIV